MTNNNKGMAILDLIGRILLASIFIFAAIGKIKNYHGTAMFMAAYGLPTALLPIVIAVEILGGLGVIMGLWTRWAALLLAIFSALAIAIFHHTFQTANDQIITLAEVSFTGGLLILAVNGASCLSVDAWRKRK